MTSVVEYRIHDYPPAAWPDASLPGLFDEKKTGCAQKVVRFFCHLGEEFGWMGDYVLALGLETV